MKDLKVNFSGIILCLFELVVGILLLIEPIGFTSWIIMIAGIALMVFGLVQSIKYFKEDAEEASIRQTLVKGIIAIFAGAFCTFKTDWFIVTFPVLAIIYGLVILVTGIGKIQLAVDMVRQKNKKWFWAAINAVVSIICAIVVLCNPFTSTVILWIFTGASLLVEGILDVITLIAGRKTDEEE